MTGEVGWMLSLLLLLFLASANISQAAPIDNSVVEEEAIEENADSSTSKDVELIAEIPDEDDKELINELVAARPPRRGVKIQRRVRVVVIRIRKKN
ncbi:unnamed protein product [Hymenolepis diminuta]|uniref:Ribonuclease E/G n=1 Tax=Hymenolepis diminuta TaxID=6216 RepID=A0A0R3SMK2_HYMDI|nr:unnamed protein product [Hymenolepis diminuta]